MNIFDEWQPQNLYCSIGAAIVGGGALGAGASIFGANKAADAQTNAANSAIAAQQQQFQQTKQIEQPFIDVGTQTAPKAQAFSDQTNPNSPLSQLLALTTPGPNQNATLAQTPGYQFSLQQGNIGVQNALAARGLAGPGGALAKGGANFAEGLAGTTWQNVVNALQNTYSSGSGALQNLLSTGGNAANALGGASTTTGQGISNNLIGAGNAQAGAAIGTANALGGLGNSISSAAILSKLLGTQSGTQASSFYGNQAGVGGPLGNFGSASGVEL